MTREERVEPARRAIRAKVGEGEAMNRGWRMRPATRLLFAVVHAAVALVDGWMLGLRLVAR